MVTRTIEQTGRRYVESIGLEGVSTSGNPKGSSERLLVDPIDTPICTRDLSAKHGPRK